MTQNALLTALAIASLKGVAVLAVAGLVTLAWRSASAATRHLIWTIGVAGALAVPALGLLIAAAGGPRVEVGAWTPPLSEPAASVASSSVSLSTTSTWASITRTPTSTAGIAEVEAAEPGAEPGAEPAAATTPDAAPSALVRTAGTPRDWRSMLFWIWIGGALIALLPLGVALARVRAIERRARPAPASRWVRLMAESPAISHLAFDVRVLESDEAAMPMTWGVVSPVLLVPSSSRHWPDWQCRNILLHELAHVERRDCLTQLIAQIACAVYWFNPLAWIAAYRMQVERELACDDRVISAGSPATDYASNLIAVARSLRAPAYTSQSAIAMARPSQLSDRLQAVLDSSRNRGSVTRRVAAGATLGGAALALLLASVAPGSAAAAVAAGPTEAPAASLASMETAVQPAASAFAFSVTPAAVVRASQLPAVGLVPSAANVASSLEASATPAPPSLPSAPPVPAPTQDRICWLGDGNTSINTHNSDKDGSTPSVSVRFSRDDCSLEFRADGKFTMRSDLADIESLARGGWVRIEERVGRETRRLDIRNDDGTLERLYYVNGNRTAYDERARTWLAQTLLQLERRTAFAADTRVPQLYRTGGLRAVMGEIAQMRSAHAKSRYYTELLGTDVRLDANSLNSIVRQASSDLSSSDHYLSQVLGRLGSHPAANESTWRAFAEAAGTMKSDHYKSQVLTKVLSQGRLSNETVGVLLRAASSIKSDHYLTELLKAVAAKYAMNAGTSTYYAEALRTVQSDHYRAELISAMNKSGEWDSRTAAFVISSIGDIKSDHYKSQALIGIIKARHVTSWPAFFSATTTIGSGHYMRQTLGAALDHDPLTREIVAGVLATALRLPSDFEKAELLRKVAAEYRLDDGLRQSYERVVDSMSSEHYRGLALSALRRSMARETVGS